MHKIDSTTATTSLPTPNAPGPGTPGYFAHGDGASTPYTILTSDWCNAVQMELVNVIEGAGLPLSKTRQDQLLKAIQSLGRIKLTADLILNVTKTGSDTTGDGSIGKPFLTPQKAATVLLTQYDLAGFKATIQLGPGTYDSPGPAPTGGSLPVCLVGGSFVGAINQGAVTLLGNVASPSSVTIRAPANGYGIDLIQQGSLVVSGITFTGVGGPECVCIGCGQNTLIQTGPAVIFGSCPGGTHITIANGGAGFLAGYTISGGALYHIQLGNNAWATMSAPITFVPTPAFSGAFVFAATQGQLIVDVSPFTGGAAPYATGKKYIIVSGAQIATVGGGGLIPGNIPGTGSGVQGALYI